jgi:hypothetical protein
MDGIWNQLISAFELTLDSVEPALAVSFLFTHTDYNMHDAQHLLIWLNRPTWLYLPSSPADVPIASSPCYPLYKDKLKMEENTTVKGRGR